MCFFARIKIGIICKTKKPVSLQERGPAALGGVGRGVVPRLGGTQRKGGDFPAECPLKWGWGSFPGRSPCAAERRLRGTPGARIQPRTRGCPGASPAPLVSPQPCGDFGGEKVPEKCPPPPPPRPRRVDSHPRLPFPRPAARRRLLRLPFSQGRESCSPFNENPGG